MSYEFLLRNLNRISRPNKEKLVVVGYLVRTARFRSDGGIQKYEYALTEKAEIFLGLKKPEEKSKHLRFCSACGKGHWRKGKQFCSEECKTEKNITKKKKELDFEAMMKEIRANKKAKIEEQKKKQRIYYAENKEKLLDYGREYYYRKTQEKILITILTTTI